MRTINLISVPVSDQDVSKDFYIRMGLRLVTEVPMSENRKWIQLQFPESHVSITLVTWFPQMTPGCLQGITILTDDIAAEVKRLEAQGIRVGAIGQEEWGQFADVTDPDGNGWILHQQ